MADTSDAVSGRATASAALLSNAPVPDADFPE
jgi:hypothetical protein